LKMLGWVDICPGEQLFVNYVNISTFKDLASIFNLFFIATFLA